MLIIPLRGAEATGTLTLRAFDGSLGPMIRVGLDVSALDHEKISGVGIYVKHLSYHLARLPDVQLQTLFRLSRIRNRQWMDQHAPIKARPFVDVGPLFWPSQLQVFHGPDFRLPRTHKIPKVVTIHDLAFYDRGMTSEAFARQRMDLMERTLNRHRPDLIIAVSENTKHKICERFPKWEKAVRVVHLGADHIGIRLKTLERMYDFPYFLFVGNLEARKNVVGLIKAFEILAARPAYRDVRLVLVGKPGFDYESIEKAWRESPAAARIVSPGFVSNSQLSALYAFATAFVLPTFHEGFGIPVLEAMGSNCPVITSLGTSTEEVAGAAARLVDPRQPEQICEAMAQLLSSPQEREELISRGRTRFSAFRWRNCAEQTLAVYRQAVG